VRVGQDTRHSDGPETGLGNDAVQVMRKNGAGFGGRVQVSGIDLDIDEHPVLVWMAVFPRWGLSDRVMQGAENGDAASISLGAGSGFATGRPRGKENDGGEEPETVLCLHPFLCGYEASEMPTCPRLDYAYVTTFAAPCLQTLGPLIGTYWGSRRQHADRIENGGADFLAMENAGGMARNGEVSRILA
jgi:hypothetical protein